MLLDRQRLIKLMNMTTSSNDGEALAAIRKANALLKVNGMNWSEFISGIKQQPLRPAPRPMGRGTMDTAPEYPRPQSRFTDKDIPRMLQSLMRDTKGSFHDVVASWNEYWQERGYLTERQYESLINAYERAK